MLVDARQNPGARPGRPSGHARTPARGRTGVGKRRRRHNIPVRLVGWYDSGLLGVKKSDGVPKHNIPERMLENYKRVGDK
jgi:hypothetical protein